jgi:enamine deaminase RidA (YjgF/YER057c/UK114 family)
VGASLLAKRCRRSERLVDRQSITLARRGVKIRAIASKLAPTLPRDTAFASAQSTPPYNRIYSLFFYLTEFQMIRRHGVGKRLSEMVTYHGFLFLAGQVAKDPSKDVKGQTEEILAQIDELLEEGGATKKGILSATIYLSDITTFAQMNEAWEAWVPEGHTPARATVEAKLANPAYKVEIQVIACNGMSQHGGHDHGHDH